MIYTSKHAQYDLQVERIRCHEAIIDIAIVGDYGGVIHNKKYSVYFSLITKDPTIHSIEPKQGGPVLRVDLDIIYEMEEKLGSLLSGYTAKEQPDDRVAKLEKRVEKIEKRLVKDKYMWCWLNPPTKHTEWWE